MNGRTPDLFDFGTLPPAAATADPATSKAAARELERSGGRAAQTVAVAELVRRHPGCTTLELAALGTMDRHAIARRTRDAERAGLIREGAARVCTASAKRLKALTWWPVEGNK